MPVHAQSLYSYKSRNFQLSRLKLSMRLGPMSDLHQGSIIIRQVEDLLHVDYFQPPLERGQKEARRAPSRLTGSRKLWRVTSRQPKRTRPLEINRNAHN